VAVFRALIAMWAAPGGASCSAAEFCFAGVAPVNPPALVIPAIFQAPVDQAGAGNFRGKNIWEQDGRRVLL
jgi:hypothetical protein